ncbi:MAG: cation-transporting P-type ATPase, partial [Nanoarchaeota archaeon]|nr:cation-transporting P-type ATPase [Nanoarchaeota archaeon]
KEAKKKLEQYGPNEIKEISNNSPFKILLRQIKSNFIIYLLLIATVLSFIVGKNVTGYTILVVILMVIVVGFMQEYRAEKALKMLKKMIMPVSITIRDGKEKEELSINLVPDDLIILRSGEKIPADCVILEQKELLVNEAVLTGEFKEVTKELAVNMKNYSDSNMLFMGAFVIKGRCICKVLHTGMNTRFGKIAKMISTAEKELPLQKKVNTIAKYMASFAIFISIITGLLMIFRAEAVSSEFLIEVLILVIALSVSAFPEGLPVVLITSLASGAYKMAKKNAIVNRMSVIETLGETTVICSDKTGTITKGEMTVKKIFSDNRQLDISGAGYETTGKFLLGGKEIDVSKDSVLNLMFKAATFCNDTRIERIGDDNIYRPIGTPTEAALLIMSAKAGILKDDLKFERLEEIPFSSDRKMMSVFGKFESKNYVFVKGAPEILLDKCKSVQRKDGIFTLTSRDKKRILGINKEMTKGTMRTLSIAYKKSTPSNKNKLEEELVFLGLVGMEDPPREEVKESIKTCINAGISVKMITGDNKETAIAIAKQIDLEGQVIEGYELDKISDSELESKIKLITIFARVRPEHKLRIVKALKNIGEVVTMTGDGVNDAPALKEAHIGIAMGKNGTDVTREVSDLTLKDDNFVTIVSAIKEGRTIFRNIKKFVTYQLSCNFAELTILFMGVLLAPIFGWQIPILLALQILFMNLVTDNLPAITLGFNPSSTDVMDDKPMKKAEILDKKLILLLIFTGMILAILTLVTIYVSFNIFNNDFEYARTTALVSLIILEIASAFNFRSFRKGVLNRSLFVNKYLVLASVISFIAAIIIVYTPLNGVFGTVAIPLVGWAYALIPGICLIGLFDLLKYINHKKKFFNLEHV